MKICENAYKMRHTSNASSPCCNIGVERIFFYNEHYQKQAKKQDGAEIFEWLLVIFIGREFFLQIKDEDIINYFQSIKDRKVAL